MLLNYQSKKEDFTNVKVFYYSHQLNELTSLCKKIWEYQEMYDIYYFEEIDDQLTNYLSILDEMDVVLVDANDKELSEDDELIKYLKQISKEYILIRTKDSKHSVFHNIIDIEDIQYEFEYLKKDIKNRNDLITLSCKMEDIGIKHFNNKQYMTTLYYYQRALDLDLMINDISISEVSLRNLSIVYSNIGKVYEELSNHGMCQYYYELAEKTAIDLTKTYDTDQNSKRLLNCLVDEISLYSKLKDTTNTIKYYQKAIDIHEKMEEKNYRSIGILNRGLADLCVDNYQIDEALICFDKAYEAFMKDDEISDDEISKHHMALLYQSLGVLNRRLNKIEEALDCHQKEMEIYHKLYEQTHNDKYQYSLSYAYVNMAETLYQQRKKEDVEKYMELAIQLRTKMVDQNDSYDNMLSLSKAYVKYGEMIESYDVDKANALYLNSEKWLNIIMMKYRDNVLKHELAITKIKLFDIYLGKKQYEKASSYLDSANRLINEVYDQYASMNMKRYRTLIFERYAQFYKEQYDDLKAIESMNQAIDISNELYESSNSEQIANDLVHQYHELGIIYKGISKYDEAIEALNKALKYCIEDHIIAITKKHIVLSDLYNIYCKVNDYDKQLVCLNKLVELTDLIAPYYDPDKMDYLKKDLQRRIERIRSNN